MGNSGPGEEILVPEVKYWSWWGNTGPRGKILVPVVKHPVYGKSSFVAKSRKWQSPVCVKTTVCGKTAKTVIFPYTYSGFSRFGKN